MSKIIKSQFVLQEGPIIKRIGVKTFGTESEVVHENVEELHLKTLHQNIDNANIELQSLKEEIIFLQEKAKEEIENQKQQWEVEKELAMEKAKQEGFQKGYFEGQQKGYEEYANTIASAHEIVDLAKIDYEKTIQSSEEALLKLSVTIAERILGNLLDENQGQFVQVVKRVLKEVKEHDDIQISVHPEQYPFVIAQKEELDGMLIGETKLYIYADEDMKPYSCTIDSSYGKVDASIDTQLNEIRSKLLEIAEEGASDES